MLPPFVYMTMVIIEMAYFERIQKFVPGFKGPNGKAAEFTAIWITSLGFNSSSWEILIRSSVLLIFWKNLDTVYKGVHSFYIMDIIRTACYVRKKKLWIVVGGFGIYYNYRTVLLNVFIYEEQEFSYFNNHIELYKFSVVKLNYSKACI